MNLVDLGCVCPWLSYNKGVPTKDQYAAIQKLTRIARALGSNVEVENDGKSTSVLYRSPRLPKEGAYDVGEADYNGLCDREEKLIAKKAGDLEYTVDFEEKSWVAITLG